MVRRTEVKEEKKISNSQFWMRIVVLFMIGYVFLALVLSVVGLYEGEGWFTPFEVQCLTAINSLIFLFIFVVIIGRWEEY